MNPETIAIIERIEREGMSAPYGQARMDGICDFNDGAAFTACPYPEGSTAQQVWQAAWLIQRGYSAGLARLGEISDQHRSLKDLMIMHSAVANRLNRAGGITSQSLNLTDDEDKLEPKLGEVSAELAEAVRLYEEIEPQLPVDDRTRLNAYVDAARKALGASGTNRERLTKIEDLLDGAHAAYHRYEAA